MSGIWNVTPSDGATPFQYLICSGTIGSARYDNTSTREMLGRPSSVSSDA